MHTPVRYSVPDLLTLFAVAAKYPNAFVAPGPDSRQFFCVSTLMINDRFLDAFEAERWYWLRKVKHQHPIILYPTWRDAEAMDRENANMLCRCTLLLSEHGASDERPNDRPDGVVPPDVQERSGTRPARQRRRKAHR